MLKRVLVATLLVAAIPAPAHAKGQPEKGWWCGPSGQDNYTPIKKLKDWLC